MRDCAQLVDLPAMTRWAIGLVAVCGAASAHAQEPAEAPVDLSAPAPPPPPSVAEEDSWLSADPVRRCGFALGLSVGGMLGTASGYPNDALKIDRDGFETDIGFGYGGQVGLYLGIALADWFVLGLGPSIGQLRASAHDTGFFAGSFHIDAFPAFGAGGVWRDLGLTIDAGLGMLETTDADEVVRIESGFGSRLAMGVVWEGVRAWKLSMGPYAAADLMWSPSSMRPTASLGWRTTFYAGPADAD